MKNLQRIPVQVVRISALLLMVFMTTITWAQDKGIDIDVDLDKGGGDWYNHPVAWIVGGAVFILLLVALLKGNKSSS